MNYELAKKLKDAGFPQGNDTYIDVDGIQWLFTNVLTTIDKAYAPSLSELIEACGKQFGDLSTSWDATNPNNLWWCGYGEYYGDGEYEHYVHALSPEEVVAKLWLSLNEKK